MDKVYTYPQKIFKSLAALAVIFGVTSCATSQSTAASSGETDGIYYSPSRDGQVQYVSNETPQDYEIKVGGAYFDANGNGAEEFYYEDAAPETQDVNVYTGGSNAYSVSGSTDWGRYDGVDITVNNWGWNDPWMMGWGYGGWGFNNWGWGMGWNSWRMGWGYGGGWGWHNPYWGWGYGGGWGWGFNNWGWGNPYWGYGGGFYGGYYGNGYYGNGYYWRNNRIQSGVRPGANLAFSHGNMRGNMRGIRGNSYANNNVGIRPTRGGNQNIRGNNNVRNNQSNVRPVRSEQPVRSNNIRTNEGGVRPVRSEGNIRTDNNVRPVRATVPNEVRQNNNPVRTNNNPVRTTQPNRGYSPQRNNTPIRSNQGIQSNPSRGSNSGGIRSGGGSPSRGSGGGGGGIRSGGGRR